MSAENVIARGGRDVEPSGEEAGFQMPPELAKQYQVRVIEPNDGSERRIGMFMPGDRQNPSIEISGIGDRIVARNEEPETVAALVKIAKHNGWEGIDVEGSPEFRQAVWAAGTREGIAVRGYEPNFEEQARMEELRRADAARREREAAERTPTTEQVAPKPAVEVAEAIVPGRSADADRSAGADQDRAASSAVLSEADQGLLLRLSAYTRDRKALYENLRDDMPPMERQFQEERIDVNRDVLNASLEAALESPTLVEAFGKSGYQPDDLEQMAREGEWDGKVADAIYLVRNGLNRNDPAKDAGSAATVADEIAADRDDRLVAESTAAPVRQTAPEPEIAREERQREAGADRRSESEELAELFLHGGAERISAEPRLANALEAQATMEKHLGEVFEGDAAQISAAALESRQMISDVLRRGLDVSVREPTPVRQIEPPQPTLDLER